MYMSVMYIHTAERSGKNKWRAGGGIVYGREPRGNISRPGLASRRNFSSLFLTHFRVLDYFLKRRSPAPTPHHHVTNACRPANLLPRHLSYCHRTYMYTTTTTTALHVYNFRRAPSHDDCSVVIYCFGRVCVCVCVCLCMSP